MKRDNNKSALIVFLSGIAATACAMVLAVVLASPRPVVVVLNTSAQALPAGPDKLPAVAVAAAPAPVMPEVLVARVPGVPASVDPSDPLWNQCAKLDAALQPQGVAQPMLDKATVSQLTVQGMRDSQRVAFRLSWDAPAPSSNVDVGRFCDAVALQFAGDPSTPFVMGGPGKPVHILHWKAIWQKDIEKGYQQARDLHPNFWWDFYWFADKARPLAQAIQNPQARQFLVALAAGNPMVQPERQQPVEEIVAEGFGSVTHVKDALSAGKGVWKDGRWSVVITRPLSPGDPIGKVLSGATPSVALAVWDGSASNVGGRKHYCGWIPLKVQP